MRRGQPRLVGQRERRLIQGSVLSGTPPGTKQEAEELVKQLELGFTDGEDDADVETA
jgi:hypothetical protein